MLSQVVLARATHFPDASWWRCTHTCASTTHAADEERGAHVLYAAARFAIVRTRTNPGRAGSDGFIKPPYVIALHAVLCVFLEDVAANQHSLKRIWAIESKQPILTVGNQHLHRRIVVCCLALVQIPYIASLRIAQFNSDLAHWTLAVMEQIRPHRRQILEKCSGSHLE